EILSVGHDFTARTMTAPRTHRASPIPASGPASEPVCGSSGTAGPVVVVATAVTGGPTVVPVVVGATVVVVSLTVAQSNGRGRLTPVPMFHVRVNVPRWL